MHDEGAGGGPREGVGGFIAQSGVGLGLDDEAGAGVPDEFAADEFARASERIALEKAAREHLTTRKRIEEGSGRHDEEKFSVFSAQYSVVRVD